MLSLDISSGFNEGALGQLRCDWRFGFWFGRLRRLCGKLLSKGLCGDVVDSAGSALHLVAATLKELDQLLVLHSEVFGKLVYANTHK